MPATMHKLIECSRTGWFHKGDKKPLGHTAGAHIRIYREFGPQLFADRSWWNCDYGYYWMAIYFLGETALYLYAAETRKKAIQGVMAC